MIIIKDETFTLHTENTSYIFKVLSTGQLENLYYGERLIEQDYTALSTKINAGIGSSVMQPNDNKICLDSLTLEYSGIGRGDYRHTPMEVKMPSGAFVTDFVFKSFKQYLGAAKPTEQMPFPYGDDSETLEITLFDKAENVEMILYYTVFYAENVIVRSVKLLNHNDKPLVIRKIMSMMLDFPSSDYDLVTFDGGWIKEAHKHTRPLAYGVYVNESTTGASSNRHNPGIILSRKNASEDVGECIAVNLIYSGNHYEAVDISNHDMMRVMTGINPHCFEWTLEKDGSFCTPSACMSFSKNGFNGISHNMHDFVNERIVRGKFKNVPRPVLLNNWEAHFFDFNYYKLVKLAKSAAKLGVELFVLDDGWFGERTDDTRGLGDYNVNLKKLPGGLCRLAKKVNSLGMKFGLWFEPEMISEKSVLFSRHPEYAVKLPNRTPCLGRNQLVLDLCNPNVRDYIVQNVNKVLLSANISYVKWDMNRHISDMYSGSISNQGEFFHRYILGLYDILKRITEANENVLFESCSSGGNRFDLGMLCYTPQIWASDNTDPMERLDIQGGLSYLYPTAAMGAHVSMSPHQQTLRKTPLSTRFNVASFGNLGYELDLKYCSSAEKKEIKNQIVFYKQWRQILQYGDFYRFDNLSSNRIIWQKVKKRQTGKATNIDTPNTYDEKNQDRQVSIVGNFNKIAPASPASDIIKLKNLDKNRLYHFETMPQGLSIKNFGGLIKHVSPININPDGFIVGFIDKRFRLPDAVEKYDCYGDLLCAGIKLNQQFMGTWYNNTVRLLGDFGSSLYTVTEKSVQLSSNTIMNTNKIMEEEVWKKA